jgi:polar amino acid transport system permease protein
MNDFLEAFFSWEILSEAWPILLDGLGQTLLLSAIVIPLGAVGGLTLALLSTAKSRWVRWPLIAYVDVFRALPPLVLLVFVYAGLPFAGLEVSAIGAVAIGFFLNTGAYYGEIFRAGLESVPAGQAEAARAIIARRDGTALDPAVTFPGLREGLEGVAFVDACVRSSKKNGAWTSLNLSA